MKRIGLFEAYGIELEYAIVNQDDLSILPIADQLLERVAGSQVSDFEDGAITWSNELVLHVIELKTTYPSPRLDRLESEFHRSIIRLNKALADFKAILLPTAMHPLMDPAKETHVWPHDNVEIYSAYDRIFGCRTHGWSNLQSMHINLPFASEEEFVRLHTAIRLVLPLLPALAASSPIAEGKSTSALDSRLLFYQKNQARIPSIAGPIVPEPVQSISEYRERILKPMFRDIAPFDPDGLLQDDWLNSRGAITRFERQTIEIRVIDTQECPTADLAIAALCCGVIRALAEGQLASMNDQLAISTSELKRLLDRTIQEGGTARIDDDAYLNALGLHQHRNMSANEIWTALLSNPVIKASLNSKHYAVAQKLIHEGNLATRLLRVLGGDLSPENIRSVYRALSRCLARNQLFTPRLISSSKASDSNPGASL
jgi:gamma-glutamyl:cysteine ligase YbdK (ATP-grasp superfamily)